MINQNKVKLMTKLALYEETKGKEDFKISAYYRKDYAGVHILGSLLWTTVGYVCLAALVMLGALPWLMEHMTLRLVVIVAAAAVVGYVALLIVYVAAAGYIYNRKHKNARQRVKRYNHDLTQLLKMYEKEKK